MALSEQEMEDLKEITRPFWIDCKSEESPKFVVITGGTGAGKTTLRREKYAKDYVNFDFGEMLSVLEEAKGKSYNRLQDFSALACSALLEIAIESKKNIVIEIIGDDEKLITPVLDGMRGIGYEVSIEYVHADPVEAYERHVKASKEDAKYLSAYFTESNSLWFFYQKLGLGEMPVSKKK